MIVLFILPWVLMFGFELFWPRMLVSDPGFLAYGWAVAGMSLLFAVPVLVGQVKQYGKPMPIPFAMLGGCVFLAGVTGPYLLRQALTIVPFVNGVVSTEEREFLVISGERERSGESVIRLAPVDYYDLRDISLVVEPEVMVPLAEKARAYRAGETTEQDCLVLTTEVGMWGYERIYSGAVMTAPVGEMFLSKRC